MSTFPKEVDIIIVKEASGIIRLDNPDKLYDSKYDGHRAVLYYDGKECKLFSKNGTRHPRLFRKDEKKMAALLGNRQVILDGELVSMNENGKVSLRNLVKHKPTILFIAFDILFLDRDLQLMKLRDRRRILKKFVSKDMQKIIRVSEAFVGNAVEVFKLIEKNNLEGLVVKGLDDAYIWTTAWYKLKNKKYNPYKN